MKSLGTFLQSFLPAYSETLTLPKADSLYVPSSRIARVCPRKSQASKR